MPAQLTTKAQVNGYRFLLRRFEHALIRRDVRMLHDPMRSQWRSLMVGLVLAILVIAGAVILSFFRPQGAVGDSNIVLGKETGALYVVVDGTLHPVLNLASARLITGSSENPNSVKEDKLDLPRGPLLGIPGAPAQLPGSAQGDGSAWTLCDAVALSAAGTAASAPLQGSTVIAGSPETDGEFTAAPLRSGQALLVRTSDTTYLVYGAGRRAVVDPEDPVLQRTLGLGDQVARPVGPGLLNSTTQVPALTPPKIAELGEPGPGKLSDLPVGAVIRVSGVDSTELYVVLAGGVQPVSPFAAEVIRNAHSQDMKAIADVPPDRIVGVPVRNELPVDRFPAETPEILSPETHQVACTSWTKSSPDAPAEVTLLAGRELPLQDSWEPVDLITADGGGDRVDSVYLRPMSGEFVQVTGIAPGSIRRGSLFYVADNGIRYGIPDAETAAVLGFEGDPKLAPWEVVGQLVPGPELSETEALSGHDTLPTGTQ